MQIKLDSHTHTLASGHAYSTILENAQVAADKGLSLLAITDHAPGMIGSPTKAHFYNFKVLDRVLHGVEMLYGIEADIIDFDGKISMEQEVLSRMDIGIASFHEIVFRSGSKAENTRAYLGAMQTPGIAVIGHPDDGRISLDYEALVVEAKRVGVLLEVNNSSLSPGHHRQNAWENYKEILKLSEKHGALITLGSDAHFATAVGELDSALRLLEELQFPEELVVNTDPARFKEILAKRK